MKIKVYLSDEGYAHVVSQEAIIKELFKLWEIATTQFSSKDPRVIKIRELGVEMPADFLKKDA